MTKRETLVLGGHTFTELDATKPIPKTITRSHGIIILQDRNTGLYTVVETNKLGTQLAKVVRSVGLNIAITEKYGDKAAENLRFFYLELGHLSFHSHYWFELVPHADNVMYPGKEGFNMTSLGRSWKS